MAQPHFRIIFQFLATKMGELPAKATIGIGSKVVSLARLIIDYPYSYIIAFLLPYTKVIIPDPGYW